MSTGHPTGHGQNRRPITETPDTPDTDHETAGQRTGHPTGHTGHAEHRTPTPPLERGAGVAQPAQHHPDTPDITPTEASDDADPSRPPRRPDPSALHVTMSEVERAAAAALGARVLELRQAAGMTQAQLGRLAGRAGGTIGKMERAYGRLTVSSVGDVAGALAAIHGDESLRAELLELAGPAISVEVTPRPNLIEREQMTRLRRFGSGLAATLAAHQEEGHTDA